MARPSDLGLSAAQVAARFNADVERLIATGNTAERRARLVELMRASHHATVGACGLDETLELIREEMRKFADSEVIGHAQTWHRTNSYIPMEIIRQMSELGVFGLTIPETFGGMGLGKESMCVVSEELARGYIGVGSLGTRSEIAAELILGSGTTEQKQKWLPKIASGEVLPTAVFTEPNTGSDLASIKTRAVREGNVYKVYGNKTWITHPVRADLMTLLVRTNPNEKGHRGLSMLLAEKLRGNDANPFPAKGMSGTEIEVLGYRGMKEYEIAFDGFEVKAENLLGGVEGLGFKQLMQTFEFGAHPDGRPGHRRGAGGDGAGARLRAEPRAVRRADRQFPTRFRQDRHDGGGDHDCASGYLPRRPRKGLRPPLRPGSWHGQVARRAHRLGQCRQRGTDPWRQRLCIGISGFAHPVRRAHFEYFRGRRGDPGAGHCPPAARRHELTFVFATKAGACAFDPRQRAIAVYVLGLLFIQEVFMSELLIHRDEWVVVCDGAKALVLQNTGDAKFPNLKTVAVYEQKDLATHELGTDRPGRAFSPAGHGSRSSVEQTDWHDQSERLFLTELTHKLDAALAAGKAKSIILVAPPRALGMIRPAYSHALRAAVRAELDKDMVKLPIHEIEKHLTAA